jgi:hypothetical protein
LSTQGFSPLASTLIEALHGLTAALVPDGRSSIDPYMRKRSMRNPMPLLIAACASAVFTAAACTGGTSAPAQAQASTPAAAGSRQTFLQWPVLPGNEAYAVIDGKHLHTYVVDQAAISRRYRDQGHPQSWGRLVGTSGDEESVKWFLDKYKQIGLSDVRAQPLDLAPKWFPQSWEVSVTAGGRTMPLVSARPGYRGPVTPPGGLDLEVVNVGSGSESEFAGHDVRGKAVVIFDLWAMGPAKGALQRAEGKGRSGHLQRDHPAREPATAVHLAEQGAELLIGE